MKILYFVCGEGLGHATRTIAANEQLSKKHELVFVSYGYAKDFLKKSGLKTIEVSPELHLAGDAGALDIKKSFVDSFSKFRPKMFKEYSQVISKHSPDIVISDSFFYSSISC